MTVYPDLALILGLLIHGFSYRLMLFAMDIVRKRGEMIALTAVSGISSAIILIPAVPTIVPLLIGLLCLTVILRGKTVRGTVVNVMTGVIVFSLYLGAFFVVSGVFLGLICFLSNDGGYFLLSFHGSIISAVFSYMLLNIILRIKKTRQTRPSCCDCVLTVEGRKIPFRCFVDTGNFLTDPVSGYPVVVMEYQVLRQKFGLDFPQPLTYEFAMRFSHRARVIPYHSVDGEGQMLSAFVAEKFTVNGIPRNAVIAITLHPLESRGQFCGILSPDLIGGEV